MHLLKSSGELRDVQSKLLYARCCLDLKEYETVLLYVCITLVMEDVFNDNILYMENIWRGKILANHTGKSYW